jgi:hypothetical protein
VVAIRRTLAFETDCSSPSLAEEALAVAPLRMQSASSLP